MGVDPIVFDSLNSQNISMGSIGFQNLDEGVRVGSVIRSMDDEDLQDDASSDASIGFNFDDMDGQSSLSSNLSDQPRINE